MRTFWYQLSLKMAMVRPRNPRNQDKKIRETSQQLNRKELFWWNIISEAITPRS